MVKETIKENAKRIFELAGIHIDGKRRWDIQVHNEQFYPRVLAGGSLALGESYMDGWWDCEDLDEFFCRLLIARLDEKITPLSLAWDYFKARAFNLQKGSRAFTIGKAHYDIGNDLYARMLDKRMVYTCAYWRDANDLDSAQQAKLDLVCRKIGIKRGMRVLDIGCGWGSFAKYAAQKHGAEVVGVTVSKEQATLGRKMCKGLPVEIRLCDYRDVDEKFDRIVSLGMFEHVGYKNYKTYFEVASRCLKDDGLFLLQTIGGNASVKVTDPWISKYIFPNSMLPSLAQIGSATEGLFVLEDLHNLSAHYDKTLMAWHANFEKDWPAISKAYGERFHRMWRYYLLSCAGSFRARKNQVWQIVFSKEGVKGGYRRLDQS